MMIRAYRLNTKTTRKVLLTLPLIIISCQKQDMPSTTTDSDEIIFGASAAPCVVETRCTTAPDPTAVYDACETEDGHFVAMVESSFSRMDAPNTRTETTDATLDAAGFGVSCYQGTTQQWGAVFTAVPSTDPDYNPNIKVFKGGVSWPATEPSPAFTFYAWNYTTNSPSPTYPGGTIVFDTQDTGDVIMAKVASATYKQTNHLQFQHITGRLGTVTLEAEEGMIISNVSVSVNGKVGAMFDVGTMDWSTSTNFTKYQTFNDVAPSAAGSKDNELYLVPGEHEFTATYDYTMFGETFTGIVAVGKFTIVAGQETTLKILFTGDAEPFTLEAVESGKILLTNRQILYSAPYYQLSKNGGEWSTVLIHKANGYYSVDMAAGDRLRIKASYNFGLQVSSTMKIYAYGNIASLYISKSETKQIGYVNSDNNDMQYMFSDCQLLYSHPDKDIVFPKWDYGLYVCQYMFKDCINLERAPKIEIRNTIGTQVFQNMFSGCTGLKYAPGVSVETIDMSGSVVDRDYASIFGSMFYRCTALETVDEIRVGNITGTGKRYFTSMFAGCTALEESPFINIATVPEYGLQSVFNGCTNLRSIKAAFTDISASNCLSGWLSGVSSTGTFYKNPSATYDNSGLGLPSGWTVSTY